MSNQIHGLYCIVQKYDFQPLLMAYWVEYPQTGHIQPIWDALQVSFNEPDPCATLHDTGTILDADGNDWVLTEIEEGVILVAL